jgi:hypothetical protein
LPRNPEEEKKNSQQTKNNKQKNRSLKGKKLLENAKIEINIAFKFD